jgi:hypothetical protein
MMACNVAWALVAAIFLLSVNSQKAIYMEIKAAKIRCIWRFSTAKKLHGQLKVLKSSAF